MRGRAFILGVIDAFRGAALVLTVPVIAIAALIGSVAYSDFAGRGCLVGEAMQCSDARNVVTMAVFAAVVGPFLWAGLTVARKVYVLVAREAAE